MRRAAVAAGLAALAVAGGLVAWTLVRRARIAALPVPRLEGWPAWQRTLEPTMAVPDVAAHPPLVVGDVVVVAGSQVGVRGLARADGRELWRRPGGAVPPVALGPREVLVIRDCEAAVGVPAGFAVLGCFDLVDPRDVSVRAAGVLQVALDDACPGPLPRHAELRGGEVVLSTGACALAVSLPDGRARPRPPLAAPPADPTGDCGHAADGTRWCQVIDGARSLVAIAGARVPGLAVLAAAHDAGRTAAVVRRDATLQHDDLYLLAGGEVQWRWELPAVRGGRIAPVGLSLSAAGLFVLHDRDQVTAFLRDNRGKPAPP